MTRHLSQDHISLVFLLLVLLSSALDLGADLAHGVAGLHLLQEGSIMLLACVFFFWIALRLRQSRQLIQRLHRELAASKAQSPPEDVTVAKQQLAEAIAQQFQRWQLSHSEQEIGWLLLKGYSSKEIAALRGTADKTIRQQASSLYNKAGLSGRHAFSAWFIEDLL